MRPTRRALAAVSRRLERPELLAAFYPGARVELREQIALNAVLAAALALDSCYVDVGTNRGQVLAEAVRLAPSGRHIAFEPIPELAAVLDSSFPQVDCRRLALSSAPGRAEFCHFRELDGWSGLRRNPQISDGLGRPEYIDVEVSTLDVELEDRWPRVVKIDVEGAETQVLEGGRELLSRCRPLVVFEHVAASAAIYGARPGALWDVLDALGYRIFSIAGDGPFSRSDFAAARSVINWLAAPALSAAR